MDTKRPHQAHAAFCRHAASAREQAAYWAELDSRFHSFQEHLPDAPLQRFCACQRQDAAKGRTGFRTSTIQTWLRDWRRRHESVSEFNEGSNEKSKS